MNWQDAPVDKASSMPSASWQDAPRDIAESTDWSGLSNIARKAGRVAAPAVFPTIGAVLGTPFGPLGNIAGGLGGVAVNQILGITEPGVIEPAAQAIVPGGAKALGAAKRLLPAFGTEARGAETLHKLATPEIYGIYKKLYPKTPSAQLFKDVEQAGTKSVGIPTAEQAAKEELEKISRALPSAQQDYSKLRGYAEDIQAKSGQMELPQFQQALHDIGKKTQVDDPLIAGGFKQIYKGMMQDLESEPVLKGAREAFKREMVLKELKNLSKTFVGAGAGDVEKFTANKLINRLNDPENVLAKSFKSAFTPEEQKMVLDKLTLLNKLPAIQPGAGQTRGSEKFLKGTLPYLAAGGAAGYAVNPALGVTIAGIPYTARMARDLSIAWQMDEGKELIRGLLKNSGGKFTPEVWAGIQSIAASAPVKLSPDLPEVIIEKAR